MYKTLKTAISMLLSKFLLQIIARWIIFKRQTHRQQSLAANLIHFMLLKIISDIERCISTSRFLFLILNSYSMLRNILLNEECCQIEERKKLKGRSLEAEQWKKIIGMKLKEFISWAHHFSLRFRHDDQHSTSSVFQQRSDLCMTVFLEVVVVATLKLQSLLS